ncbi:alanine--tRNA ligase [Patescibacteria group bacterium]|nr:alanine--tRNA ligase [Patescibacteria group bacterium]MBU1703711.1 alanine--tRNA ligase [Patescibacteria group bacterium]MBU1953534.1 alanine--tRNA ligase [Patescibacteria group bacterium]
MKTSEIRQRYIDFFVKKHRHKEISSGSIIPENDPTVLFTTAGMHPLVPYLMGEPHPAGKRLVDSQKCLRTDDIDEVGDTTHCTFFEMLGNWSLGDYFKEEAIKMSFEFLTSSLKDGGLGLDPDRLVVSCFAGDDDAPRDEEAAAVWESLGFTRVDDAQRGQKRLIYFFGKKENWWGPAGQTGPCGPDTEMFYDTVGGEIKSGDDPSTNGQRFVEIWNDVFMQYYKKEDGTFEPLKQKNVDTGMGLERTAAIMQGVKSHYETDHFLPMKEKIKELSTGEKSGTADEQVASARIICDHMRAATFILGDPWGVCPSNKDQGYILRRLVRRAIRHAKMIGINGNFTHELAQIVIDQYGNKYTELAQNKARIFEELRREEEKFQKTIEQGIREMRKIWNKDACGTQFTVADGEKAFYIYETYGFPLEMIEEELAKIGYKIDVEKFRASFGSAMKKHQELSRSGSEQKFAGGLADHSIECTNLHTATHLLNQALIIVLGHGIEQKGSNITRERLRFDFNYNDKLTPEQIKQVEDIVNEQIKRDLPVSFEITSVDEAKKRGATGVFPDRYDAEVKVYRMGDFSYEICGGPHATKTGNLKAFKITKQESCGAGLRRLKAVIGEEAVKLLGG